MNAITAISAVMTFVLMVSLIMFLVLNRENPESDAFILYSTVFAIIMLFIALFILLFSEDQTIPFAFTISGLTNIYLIFVLRRIVQITPHLTSTMEKNTATFITVFVIIYIASSFILWNIRCKCTAAKKQQIPENKS